MLLSSRIFDCFLFFNEIEMLEFRLRELYDSVDFFVIVEATKTFTGLTKELNYKNNIERFVKYNKKIIYIVVDDLKENIDPWINEIHQRNCIKRGLLKARLGDTILIGDIDEIPDKSSFKTIQQKVNECDVVVLVQDMYYYNLSNYVSKWHAARALSYKSFKNFEENSHQIRLMNLNNFNVYREEKGGWHFSYFGGVDLIHQKINSFSHQEYNNASITKEKIQYSITNKVDLFCRDPNLIANGCDSHIFKDIKSFYLPKTIYFFIDFFNSESFYNYLIDKVVSWGYCKKQVEWGSMPENTLKKLSTILSGNGLQVGGFVGITHCYLSCKLQKKGGTLCTIDANILHNKVQNPMLVAYNLASLLELKNSMFVLGYAQEQMKIMIQQNLKFNFIIIDGNHDYESVKNEVELAHFLLIEGGYLVLDDIDHWDGPKSIYSNFFMDYKKIELDSRAGLLQKPFKP